MKTKNKSVLGNTVKRKTNNNKEELKKNDSFSVKKNIRFNIMLDEEENNLLKTLSKKHKLTKSSALHFIIADYIRRYDDL